jgi:hypothetical protein
MDKPSDIRRSFARGRWTHSKTPYEQERNLSCPHPKEALAG